MPSFLITWVAEFLSSGLQHNLASVTDSLKVKWKWWAICITSLLRRKATFKSAAVGGGWKFPERNLCEEWKTSRVQLSVMRLTWHCSSRNSTSRLCWSAAWHHDCLWHQSPSVNSFLARAMGVTTVYWASQGCIGPFQVLVCLSTSLKDQDLAAVNNVNLSALVIINPLGVHFPSQYSKSILSAV